MMVFELPHSESRRSHVRMDSRNGMWVSVVRTIFFGAVVFFIPNLESAFGFFFFFFFFSPSSAAGGLSFFSAASGFSLPFGSLA